jgi:hypothetical protein
MNKVYIYNGIQYDADQLSSMAQNAGLSLDEFISKYGVEVQEVKQDGVAEEDATVTPTPIASDLESRLAEISSELSSPVPIQKARNLRNEKYRLEKDLGNLYDRSDIDFEKPRTIINKPEDQVEGAFAQKYPWLKVDKAKFDGNKLYLNLPDERVELDLKPFTKKGEQEAIDILAKVEKINKTLSADDVDALKVKASLLEVEQTEDLDALSKLIEGTGIEIRQNKDTAPGVYRGSSSPGDMSGMAGAQPVVGGGTYGVTYDVIKDGKPIAVEVGTVDEVFDTVNNFIDKNFLDKVLANSYEDKKTKTLVLKEKLKEEEDIIKKDPDLTFRYYEQRFANDFINNVMSRVDFEGQGINPEDFKKRLEQYFVDKKNAAEEDAYELHYHPKLDKYIKIPKSNRKKNKLDKYKDLSDLPEDIGKVIFNLKKSGELNINEIVEEGQNEQIIAEVSLAKPTIIEEIIKESGDQNFLKMSERFVRDEEQRFNQNMIVRVEKTQEAFDQFSTTFAARAKEVAANLPAGTKISIETIGGVPSITLTNDNKNLTQADFNLIEEAREKFIDLQQVISTLQQDYTLTLDNINQDIQSFYAQGKGVDEDLYAGARKEYSLDKLFMKDVNDSFASLLLTVPTLLDSEWAATQQKFLDDKNKYYETMGSYNDGDFLRYATRTFGQQSANLTLAIAGGAVLGPAGLGLTPAMTQTAIATSFGLSSGTQTFRNLKNQKYLVGKAKKDGELAQKAFQNGQITPAQYTSIMQDVNKTIAMGDLTNLQMVGASFSDALIEGTITRFIGTAPNALKFVKDLKGAPAILDIAEQAVKGRPANLWNFIGKPLTTRTLGEVGEEISIYTLSEYITQAGILDREADLSQLDDTAMAAIVISGPTNISGVSYSGIMNYGITQDYKKKINSLRINNQNLSDAIAGATTEEAKQALFFSLTENLKEQGLETDMLSVDILNTGAENVKRLIALEIAKSDFLTSIGATPDLSDAKKATVIDAYKDTLKKPSEKENFENQLNAFDVTINNLKDNIGKDGSYDTAKKALGSVYDNYNAELDLEGDTSKGKERIAKVIQRFREDTVKANTEKAKNNPSVVEYVENQLTESGRPLNLVQNEALYAEIGAQLALDSGRAYANRILINTSVESILGKDTKLQVATWKNDKELKALLKQEGLNKQEEQDAFSKLKNNKTFGLIVGNKLITQNEKQAEESLAKGEIQAGTVVLHEINHAIDDGRITTREGKLDYAENLFKAAAESKNIGLQAIHTSTVKLMNKLFPDETFENSERYRDEYTKVLQEQAFAYEDRLQLEKDESSLVRAFNDLTINANALNTPKKALNYMLANNAGFRSGKLSRKSQRAINQRKGGEIKFSEKTINDLAVKYKAGELDAEQTMDFYNQYRNTALAAMGFDTRKGDIPTNKVLGFATDAFGRVTRTYDPKKINPQTGKPYKFTGWVYSTIGREGRAKIGEEIERKKVTSRISEAQEQTRLKSTETADQGIKLEERATKESQTEKSKIDPRKLPLVSRNIKEIEKEVDIKPEKVPNATFKSISDDFGKKVSSKMYGVKEDKLGKDSENLTYADRIEDGRLVKAELGQLQQDFKTIDSTRRAIKLLPEFNVVTPEAEIDTGETLATSRDLSGTSIGIANKVLDFFYEDYIDPKSLDKDIQVRRQAITNKSGRSKGSTSQTNVRRLKPEFRGTISNEAARKAQNEFAEIKRDFSKIENSKARLQAIRTVGTKLKGWANLMGGIVANTIADQKISKMPLKTAKPKKQIKADIRGGRSRVQFSERIEGIFLQPEFKLEVKGVNGVLGSYNVDNIYKFDTEDDVDTYVKEVKKTLLPLMPKDFWFGKPDKNGNYGTQFTPGRLGGMSKDIYSYYRAEMKKMATNESQKYGAPVLVDGVPTDFSKSSYDSLFKDKATILKKIASGDIADFNKKVSAIHTAMWSRFNKAIRKNKQNARVIGNYLKIVGDDRTHWHKLGAQFVGYSNKITPYKNKKGELQEGRYEYEHAMPATAAYLYLLDVSLAGVDFNTSYDFVMSNYKLISLDKASDNKLTAVGLRTSMPIGWNLLDNTWIDRYFNVAVSKVDGGIDPAGIVGLDGKTFQEIYNVNADGSPYNNTFNPDATNKIAFDNKADEAMGNARDSRKYKESARKARVFDFDDTLARSKSMVIVTMPFLTGDSDMADIVARRIFKDKFKNLPSYKQTYSSLNAEDKLKVLQAIPGKTKKINATEFARDAADLEAQGATFDFSEFSKVIDGEKGPLFEVAKFINDAPGKRDMFVLTARPANSARAIKTFLDGIGLNIPLENITGLGDGKPKAKADWFVEKYAEGYNDFYFADDALKNVKAVKDIFKVLDVKSKVQQARVKFSERLSKDFNDMIERNKGVKSEATFSDIQARRRGRNQKRFSFFVPPSADDFRGLTQYIFAGKGKQGEADQEFFDKALIKPYTRGVNAMNIARTQARNDYRALIKNNKPIRKKLKKKVGDTTYTHDEAIRVYLWTEAGFEIPGISKRDQKTLFDFVNADEDLKSFANGVKLITRKDTYLEPGEYWDGSTILGDLNNITRDLNRAEYLREFIDNSRVIFSTQNLNKIEAVYGFRVRESIENMLFRMETGQNKNKGAGRIVNAWNNWVNNSIGAIMFFNRRSALLQTLSSVNFVNWSDNNPIKAGIALANQPQYWKDFKTLWNSPMLVSRRKGLQGDLQEAEIAEAAKNGGPKGVISYLLKIGFTPTQLADSFAIATGGATFYRNRINTYKKEGMTIEEAEKKAFEDFSEISEQTQQSADPMLISQQQASVLGRLVLAFQNTPMQYTRLMKKAGQDLINRRGDPMTNISKFLYYGFVQNLIFSTLQNAVFALLPGFDDEEEDFKTDKEREQYFEKQQNTEEKKIVRTINSMSDTLLRGSGLGGAVISTIKNTIMAYQTEMEKDKFDRENANILLALSSISPPISSKLRKINSALRTKEFEEDVIAERGFDVTIDGKFQLSPAYQMLGQVTSATTNLPLDRAVDEINAITEALDTRNTQWQRLALGLGWRNWDVGARVEEHDLIKTAASKKRKEEGKIKAKETRAKNKKARREYLELKSKVYFSLPDSIQKDFKRKEKLSGVDTPIFKLKKLAEEYNINIDE